MTFLVFSFLVILWIGVSIYLYRKKKKTLVSLADSIKKTEKLEKLTERKFNEIIKKITKYEFKKKPCVNKDMEEAKSSRGFYIGEIWLYKKTHITFYYYPETRRTVAVHRKPLYILERDVGLTLSPVRHEYKKHEGLDDILGEKEPLRRRKSSVTEE